MVLILAFICNAYAATKQTAFEGITEPISQAIVSATVPGRIDSIVISEGSFVTKGQVIITLEKEEEVITEAMAKLVFESKSDLISAQQKLITYEKDYKAVKKLFETSNSVSEDQLWEKELNFKLAQAEQQKQIMIEEREALEAKMATVKVNQKVIRAPFDGVIVKLFKNPSEGVQALEPLFEIVDVRSCRMVVYVIAPEAQGMRKGMELNLELDGAKVKRFRKGKIEFISPVVDRSSLLRTIKITFNNQDGSIEPGVTGRIRKRK